MLCEGMASWPQLKFTVKTFFSQIRPLFEALGTKSNTIQPITTWKYRVEVCIANNVYLKMVSLHAALYLITPRICEHSSKSIKAEMRIMRHRRDGGEEEE